MGFCMGGALTLSISQSGKIDCGVPCYGLPSEGHGEVSICVLKDDINHTALYYLFEPSQPLLIRITSCKQIMSAAKGSCAAASPLMGHPQTPLYLLLSLES